MNKLEIINELRKCVELRFDGPTGKIWDVWYKGAYLGEISKSMHGYCIIRNDVSAPFGGRETFMAAISSFVECAQSKDVVEYTASLNKEPVIKQIGIREPKSLWQKIKGWF